MKDDIPELTSGEARASLGHSLSDLWTYVHEAFIDNSRAVPTIATQHRIFIDPASNEQYDISRCTLPMLMSDCLYQWYYSTHILASLKQSAFATTSSPAVTSSTRQLVLKNLWMTLLTTALMCAA
jgi:hypothetical protein